MAPAEESEARLGDTYGDNPVQLKEVIAFYDGHGWRDRDQSRSRRLE